jgi:hypothetical protein
MSTQLAVEMKSQDRNPHLKPVLCSLSFTCSWSSIRVVILSLCLISASFLHWWSIHSYVDNGTLWWPIWAVNLTGSGINYQTSHWAHICDGPVPVLSAEPEKWKNWADYSLMLQRTLLQFQYSLYTKYRRKQSYREGCLTSEKRDQKNVNKCQWALTKYQQNSPFLELSQAWEI